MSRSALNLPLRVGAPDMDFRSLHAGAGPLVWFSHDNCEVYQFTGCKLFTPTGRERYGDARVYWSRMSDGRQFTFEVTIDGRDYTSTPAWALAGAALFHVWYMHVTEEIGNEVYSHA